MAKKKKEPIEEIKVEDAVVESVEKAEKQAEDSFVDEFIAIQLMVLNKKPNRAKAKRLAERVLRNRKG